MDLLLRFKNFIRKENLFSPKDKLLLAVSGGVDSVVLCELCRQAGYDFVIAHCNFQLRGGESERDEQFVRGLGGKYGVEVKVNKFDTNKFVEENKSSVQESARVLRYEWFEELINNKQLGIEHLVTAHHADDNAETVLMNFCRGTGLHGLTGIPVSYGNIRRPLLEFTKDEIVRFANEHNLAYTEDSSNQSSKYTRNFFRNEIIPAIRKVYPQLKDNLSDNMERFKEIEKLYKFSVGEIKKKLVKQKGAEWHISVKQLLGYKNKALIYEIITDFGFNEKQIDEVVKLALSNSGKYIDSPAFNYRIIKHRHWFIINPVPSAESGIVLIEEKDKRIFFEEGVLEIESTSNLRPETANDTACLDAKEIAYPLILRKWKTGDYFYPLGMKKKKKIARFLIDNKLSKAAKERVWVVESNKKIIWVTGYRIDERVKVTHKTKSVLKLRFISSRTE
jgi:tRNA(Ile)-lysidine synthase